MMNRSRMQNIAILCYSVIFCIVFAEIVLRIFVPSPIFYKIDTVRATGSFMLSPDPKLIYVPKPNTGAFNSYGHRGRAFPFRRDPDKERFLFMGDSVVDGIFVPVEFRFTDLLNKKLGDRYEVINLGVSGYSYLQEFEYFKTMGIKFRPDCIFWCIADNDFQWLSNEQADLYRKLKKTKGSAFYKQYYNCKSAIEGTLLKSRLYSSIKYLIYRYRNKNSERIFEFASNWSEVEDSLKQLRPILNACGSKVIFVFMPTNAPRRSGTMEKFKLSLRKNDFVFWDLNDYNYGPDKAKLYDFPADPWHLNKDGHRLIADLLYSMIERAGL